VEPTRRVLVVIHAGGVGGMETLGVDLAREYASRGIEVTAVVPPDGRLDVVGERLVAAGARVERLWTYESGAADAPAGGRRAKLRGLVALFGVVRRIRPHVVHLHTSGGGLSAAAVCRLAARRVPLVVTEHMPPEWAEPRSRRLRCWSLDRLARAVVAVSRRNLALRRQHLGARAAVCAVVLNGVPTSCGELRRRQRAPVRATLGYGDRDVVIGTAARLVPDKRTADLVQAFARLPGDHLRLLVVGEGPDRPTLEALAARLRVDGRTTFAGFHPDARPFMAAMDVFALAVPAGSMSIALLEAMDLEVAPVITFCGPEEAVVDGETGLCAPPCDPAGLSERLRRLAEDGALRQRLGREGARHVRSRFSIARVADDYLAIYEAARAGEVPPARLRP
jgi:glycosyltransferase involved in cell wall biosynthesis